MHLPLTACLIVVVLLVGLEARRGEHHHKKRGRKHGHGHHKNSWEKRGRKLAATSDKQEIHTRKIGWLNVPEVTGCKCRHPGEICIQGPDKQPTCVQKHHLKESTRLFKHYHEMKEKAEEDLNEVDPPPHNMLHDAASDPLHNIHIHVVSHHKAPYNREGSHNDDKVQHQENGHHFLGLKPKPGKHHHKTSHVPMKAEDNYVINPQMTSKMCDSDALDEMRRRLTGWFHLLRGKEHHHHGHRSHRHLSVKKELREDDGQCRCLRSVMWEFHQIDTDKSHSLSKAEVKVIDNNDMEPCLHPYLLSCDKNSDGLLSHKEWCCCFPQKESESPCYAKLDELEATKNTEKYIPSCDREGYYHKEQCMGEAPSTQTCWCVTPEGSEIPGTRTIGRAHCGKLDNMGYPKSMS